MIWAIAEDVGVEYGRWVTLYRSKHFKDEFPEDNAHFQNVVYTDDVEMDREKSLLLMRKRMFSDHHFMAAVFIGGMSGIVDEFELFRRAQPHASILPVVSSGGAAIEVALRLPKVHDDLAKDLDYVALFHRHLDVSVREERFQRPEDQPLSGADGKYGRTHDSRSSFYYLTIYHNIHYAQLIGCALSPEEI